MNLDYIKIKEIDAIEDRRDKMLAAAVMYAESGFYVVPVRPNGKAIGNTIMYQHASKNPQTVADWYNGDYKGWNIGLACGAKDGIFVLDIDNDENKNGFETLAEIERDFGELKGLMQSTPSGGRHYIYEWFDSGASSTSKIGRGVDTRGGDGNCRSHIVAWPSRVKGNEYRWEKLEPVGTAPEWLDDLLGKPWETESNRGNENVNDATEHQFTPRDIWNMIQYIKPDSLEYDEWVKIGQAIHSQHPDEIGLKIWDKWSQGGTRYEAGECDTRWKGFKSYGPIRIGTLIHFAKEGGFIPKANVEHIDFDGESEYDALINEFNREWGIIIVGGKLKVISRQLNCDPDQDISLISLEDFKQLTSNKMISISLQNGKAKAVPKSQIWLSDEKRKEYMGGMDFQPNKDVEFSAPRGLTYNIWRGWTVIPKAGDWSKLKTHIRDIICKSNDAHFEWLLDWMADLFQDPANPKGCAVVLKGIEGSGKGTFVEAMGRTMGRHYKHLTQEEHLTGKFNGHLQDALLLFADEVIYGGSRKHAGALKALVTERKLTVERKGIDPCSYRNCAHLAIASNEDWFIPAGPQSRRWFVLETSSEKANDVSWFTDIYKEMENGGVEAMMHELMNRKITSNLSRAPETDQLHDQRVRYIDSHSDTLRSWWRDVLESETIEMMDLGDPDGEIGKSVWPTKVDRPGLYELYYKTALERGFKAYDIKSKTAFYQQMSVWGLTPSKIRVNGGRQWAFILQDIKYHINRFEASTGVKVNEESNDDM